ncbi:hypothetical protein Tco_0068378 [Tanacetum coccineum]
MRTASAAAKPCQGDSSELYLITGSIYTDQQGTVVIATVFHEVTKTLSSISIDYHSDFKEFDGGYVTFMGGAKGRKITGKGTLKTCKLDFEDV